MTEEMASSVDMTDTDDRVLSSNLSATATPLDFENIVTSLEDLSQQLIDMEDEADNDPTKENLTDGPPPDIDDKTKSGSKDSKPQSGLVDSGSNVSDPKDGTTVGPPPEPLALAKETPNLYDAITTLVRISKSAKGILGNDGSGSKEDTGLKRPLPSIEKISSKKRSKPDENAELKKKIKKQAKFISRNDLEDLLSEKVVELISCRSEIGQLRRRCDAYDQMDKKWKRKTQSIHKMCQDLNTVMRMYILAAQKGVDKLAPIKIRRSVGLQVSNERSRIAPLATTNTNFPVLIKKTSGPSTLQRPVQQNLVPSGITVSRNMNAKLPTELMPTVATMPKPTTEPMQPLATMPKPTTKPIPPVATMSKPTSEPMQPLATMPKPTTKPIPPVATMSKPTTESITTVATMPKPTTEPMPSVATMPKPTGAGQMPPNILYIPRGIQMNIDNNNQKRGIDVVNLDDEDDAQPAPQQMQGGQGSTRVVSAYQGVTNSVNPSGNTGMKTWQAVNMVMPIRPQFQIIHPGNIQMNGGTLVSRASQPNPTQFMTNNIRPNVIQQRSQIVNQTQQLVGIRHIAPLRHPAPLPEVSPELQNQDPQLKKVPPRPELKILRLATGAMVLSWNMSFSPRDHAITSLYQIYSYQETWAAPNQTLWKKLGDVKAIPLPMACTLSQFWPGNRYHFAIRAQDIHGRVGQFSQVLSITLN